MMMNKTNWLRIVYTDIILIMLVILILSLFVIPNVYRDTSHEFKPEAGTAFLVVTLIHLLLVIGLVTTIKFCFRKDDLENGFLVTVGVILILLGLMLLEVGSSFLGYPEIKGAAIAIFISIGFDFIAGILSFNSTSTGATVFSIC